MLKDGHNKLRLGVSHRFTIVSPSFHPFQVDTLVGGFPCVSLSMLTTTPGSVLDSQCESGAGYLGMEGTVKTTRPKVILIENVASLFAKRSSEKDGQTAFLGLALVGNEPF